jgi:hypothetical protein
MDAGSHNVDGSAKFTLIKPVLQREAAAFIAVFTTLCN